MQKQEFKKFIVRVLLFLSPFLAAWALELFVLPINQFTFRITEAINVHSVVGKALLPGPLYPNMEVSDREAGFSGIHTPYVSYYDTVWISDALGYRNHPNQPDPLKVSSSVVIVGDSNLAGLTLDQGQTLAYAVEAKLGRDVYPAHSIGIDYYISGVFPEAKAPEVVVFQATEKSLAFIPYVDSPGFITRLKRKEQMLRQNPVLVKLQPLSILVDRFIKQVMYRSLKAKVDYFFSPRGYTLVYTPEQNLFDVDPDPYLKPTPIDMERIVSGLVAVNEKLKSRGIRFIFLPVPNKENIYWEYLPNGVEPVFLPELIVQLRQKGVEVVDLQTPYTEAFQKHHTLLYQLDDYHWNPAGVEMAAELLAKVINEAQ